MREGRIRAVLTLAACILSGLVAIQNVAAVSQPVLSWVVAVDDAERLPVARSYRLFGAPREVVLQLTVANDSEATIVLNLHRLAQGSQIVMRSNNGEIPTAIDWSSEPTFGDSRPYVPSDPAVRLNAQAWFKWSVRIRRADAGTFEDGSYKIQVSLGDVGQALQLEAGSPRRVTDRRSELSLIVRSASTPAERAAENVIAGHRAQAAGNLDEAIRSFKAAAEADPADLENYNYLGMAYLQARRFREAVDSLGLALPLARGARSALPEHLALAYVGLGDDRSAAAVLRQAGRPEPTMDAALSELRTALTRLGSNPPK